MSETLKIETWLESLGFPELSSILMDEGYDSMEMITKLDNLQLTEIGIKKGHRKIILKAIESLNEGKSSNSTSSEINSDKKKRVVKKPKGFEPGDIVMEGWLYKKGDTRLSRAWKSRYFVLLKQENGGIFIWYKNEKKKEKQGQLHTFGGLVTDLEPQMRAEKKKGSSLNRFQLDTTSRRLIMKADHRYEKEKWIEVLNKLTIEDEEDDEYYDQETTVTKMKSKTEETKRFYSRTLRGTSKFNDGESSDDEPPPPPPTKTTPPISSISVKNVPIMSRSLSTVSPKRSLETIPISEVTPEVKKIFKPPPGSVPMMGMRMAPGLPQALSPSVARKQSKQVMNMNDEVAAAYARRLNRGSSASTPMLSPNRPKKKTIDMSPNWGANLKRINAPETLEKPKQAEASKPTWTEVKLRKATKEFITEKDKGELLASLKSDSKAEKLATLKAAKVKAEAERLARIKTTHEEVETLKSSIISRLEAIDSKIDKADSSSCIDSTLSERDSSANNVSKESSYEEDYDDDIAVDESGDDSAVESDSDEEDNDKIPIHIRAVEHSDVEKRSPLVVAYEEEQEVSATTTVDVDSNENTPVDISKEVEPVVGDAEEDQIISLPQISNEKNATKTVPIIDVIMSIDKDIVVEEPVTNEAGIVSVLLNTTEGILASVLGSGSSDVVLGAVVESTQLPGSLPVALPATPELQEAQQMRRALTHPTKKKALPSTPQSNENSNAVAVVTIAPAILNDKNTSETVSTIDVIKLIDPDIVVEEPVSNEADIVSVLLNTSEGILASVLGSGSSDGVLGAVVESTQLPGSLPAALPATPELQEAQQIRRALTHPTKKKALPSTPQSNEITNTVAVVTVAPVVLTIPPVPPSTVPLSQTKLPLPPLPHLPPQKKSIPVKQESPVNDDESAGVNKSNKRSDVEILESEIKTLTAKAKTAADVAREAKQKAEAISKLLLDKKLEYKLLIEKQHKSRSLGSVSSLKSSASTKLNVSRRKSHSIEKYQTFKRGGSKKMTLPPPPPPSFTADHRSRSSSLSSPAVKSRERTRADSVAKSIVECAPSSISSPPPPPLPGSPPPY